MITILDIGQSIYQVENSTKAFKLTKSLYSNYTFPLHMHSDIELIYVMDGELDVIADQKRFVLHAEELMFIFPNQLHGFSTRFQSKCCIFVFSQDLVPTFCMAISQKVCTAPVITAKAIKSALRDLMNHERPSLFEAQAALYQICNQLDATAFQPARMIHDDSLIHQILIYCIENYHDNISLKDFAQKAGYNAKYCSQCFHSATSINFREFVNLIRIQQSKEMLLETAKSITEIAFECGFQNIRSFNRAFQASAGISPRDFRLHCVSNGLQEKSDEIGIHKIYQFNPLEVYASGASR